MPQLLHPPAFGLHAHCRLDRGASVGRHRSPANSSSVLDCCSGLMCRGQQDLMRFTNKVVPNPTGYFPPAGPKNSGHGALPATSRYPIAVDDRGSCRTCRGGSCLEGDSPSCWLMDHTSTRR
jgi:hypothetical protein